MPRRFLAPAASGRFPAAGGKDPRWRADGKEIFSATVNGQLMATEVAARAGSLEIGRTQKLFDGVITGRGYLYDVTADGQKFIIAQEAARSTTTPLTLVQNWTAGLGHK